MQENDLSFTREDRVFNVRTAAVALRGETILVMHDQRSPYGYLPGGRIRQGETAQEALLRELEEELQCRGEILRPLWVNQGFFNEEVSGRDYHELCFYFLVRLPDTLPGEGAFTRQEGEKIHTFTWMSFDQLEDTWFYPLFLKGGRLKDLPQSLELLETYE